MEIALRKAMPSDAAGMARVRVDTWRNTYLGIVPDAYLSQLDYAADERNFQRYLVDEHSSFFTALNETGKIVGFACCGANREESLCPPGYPGEVYAIYILPAYQKGGVGRRLIRAAFEDLSVRAWFPAVIWALAENPACAFYRRIGGVEIGRKTVTIGGKELVELGFGYNDPNV